MNVKPFFVASGQRNSRRRFSPKKTGRLLTKSRFCSHFDFTDEKKTMAHTEILESSTEEEHKTYYGYIIKNKIFEFQYSVIGVFIKNRR